MAELDSDSVSTIIHRLVKQLLGQRCSAWCHACGHRSRDLLLLCSYKENESNAFEFTHSKLMTGRGYRLTVIMIRFLFYHVLRILYLQIQAA